MGEPTRDAEPLECANAIRAYQRQWLKNVRQRVGRGEPFVICNGGEFEEVLNIMDIPCIIINYYNALIAVKGLAPYYSDVLDKRGYDGMHRFAGGVATTMDKDTDKAPWGGLPRPALIIGSNRHAELRPLEVWADAFGCPIYPMEFNFMSTPDHPVPPKWWEKMRDHWDEIIDPVALDLRVEQEKALISYLEVTTGRKFSLAKLNRAMDLVNEQMDYWQMARDLIAETRPCPVSLRDQLAMYQTEWHRGTEIGRDFIKDYYDEVKHRVDKGIAANPKEKIRLMWNSGTPPTWSRYIEEKYDAVCVCCWFSSIPIDAYPRTVLNNDPLRALAGRHLMLFAHTPEWMLKDAHLHQCDGMIELATPTGLSANQKVFDAAGMPLCKIPYDKDDDKVRSIISEFIETQIL